MQCKYCCTIIIDLLTDDETISVFVDCHWKPIVSMQCVLIDAGCYRDLIACINVLIIIFKFLTLQLHMNSERVFNTIVAS